MESLEQQFAGLTPEQRRLVELWFQQQDEQPVPPPDSKQIPRRAPAAACPLSFEQQQLWLLHQLEPESSAHNFRIIIRLAGKLDLATLERSLNAVVQRHEVLRTTFHAENGQPRQIIAPALHIPLPLVELAHVPLDQRDSQMQHRISHEVEQPFDLEQGPLLRARLLRLAPEEHVLILTLHHSIFDGWSQGILLRELTTLYAAFQDGLPSPLPDLPIQYADFALWQREQVHSKAMEEQLDYWKNQLAGLPDALELPTDRPRPPSATHHGTMHHFRLAAPLVEQLKDLSRREGATLFMTLLAAFDVLLYRYTGQTDLVVGSPIAGRSRNELEDLIGCLMNMLVLRTDLSGDPSFAELLGRVRQVTLGGYTHQELPFEKLVEALQPARDLSRPPLFQMLFALQNMPMPPLKRPGLTITPIDMISSTSRLDLALFLRETGHEIDGGLEYNTDLFDATTIERWIGHYQILLADIVSNPQRPISELRLMPEVEMRRLLVEWNQTQAAYPHARCLPELFEAQVERTPQATALVFAEQHLSYAELNRRANQVAHHLRKLGAGPETLVGICLERSSEMLIALWGILKAGGAYLPLDPAYPPERLVFMLADSHTRLVLTTQHLPALQGIAGLTHVCLDADWPTIAHSPTSNLQPPITPDNLAYVIYTSGSTGQPKGVLTAHRAVVQYATAAIDHFAIEPDDRVLQFASISFDAASEEIYPCLLHGATLVLRGEGLPESAEAFLSGCQAERLTVLDLPTAYWHNIVAEMETNLSAFPPAVRLVILGGEAASPARLATWRAHAPAAIRLMNTYGPTEATIVATRCDLTGAAAPASASLAPIGRPIANAQAYVLDAAGRPAPVGVPGELYLGGAGLARGYLNRPDATAERFIPNPFTPPLPLSPTGGDTEGGRLYRTGDWVRWLPDGNLEFLGRVDHQVKLRGFRVELGEIEAVLGQQPNVHAAVVLAHETQAGAKRLVAYVVADSSDPHSSKPIDSSALRDFLKTRLPDYMLPAAFVFLDTLPLTPSGKIDHRALRLKGTSDTSEVERTQVYTPPGTPLEETLAEIWTQALEIDRIGIYDNVFNLGAHSLIATQVVHQINDTFEVKLPLRNLFEEPTIAGLAVLIERVLIDQIKNQSQTVLPQDDEVTA